MDQAQLQAKIAFYYQKLPEQTKVLFAGMSWLEILKEIDVKYGLNDEQVKTLGTETTILLLGIVSIDDYLQTIRAEIKLEGNKTEEIINEIGEKIIKDVAPLLYQAFNDNMTELMQEKFGKKFDERLASLPENIKEAISDSNYQTSIYEIGNKYSLSIEQIGILEEITIKVMTGMIKPDQYENEIKNKITIQAEKIKDVVSEINERVFKNIKELLMNNWDKEEKLPTPPYIEKKEDAVPLPPPAYNNEVKGKAIEKQIEKEIVKDIIKKTPSEFNKSDMFKEHGIEILSDEVKRVEYREEIPKKEREETRNINTTDNMNIYTEQKADDSTKSNIVTDKLFGNTSSKTVVSDYSLPKINTQMKPVEESTSILPKQHDPYHEVI
jgi:hypothetical protein